MSTPLIVALGAFAGLTVFLGLPFARLKNLPNSMQAFLNACATGILIFLFYDVISKASEPINEAIIPLQQGKGSVGSFLLNVVVFVAGLGLGLMGLVYFERWFIRRTKEQARVKNKGGEAAIVAPEALALMIAIGIGRKFAWKLKTPEVIMWGVLLGFLVGYGTDLVVTWSGL